MAVGVGRLVRSRGTDARFASTISSGAGENPPVMIRHGKSSSSASRSAWVRAAGVRLSMKRISLSPKISDAPGLQVFVEAGQREPGLLDVGIGDAPLETVCSRQQFE